MVLWRQILFQCVKRRKAAKFLFPNSNVGTIQTMALKTTVSCDLNHQQGLEKQSKIPSSQIEHGKEVISQKLAILKSVDIEEYSKKISKITTNLTAELSHSLKLVKGIEVKLDQDLKAIRERIQFAKEVLRSSQNASQNKLKVKHESSKQKPISMLNRRRCGVKQKTDVLDWNNEENKSETCEDSRFEDSLDFMDEIQASYENTEDVMGDILDCGAASLEESLWTGPSDVDFGIDLKETDAHQFNSGVSKRSDKRSEESSPVLINEGNAKKPAKPILSANKNSSYFSPRSRPQKDSSGSSDVVIGLKKFGQSQGMVCYKCGSIGHKASQCSAPAQLNARGKLSGGNNIAVRTMEDKAEGKLSDNRREIRFSQTSRSNFELRNNSVKCSNCGRTNHKTEDCRDLNKNDGHHGAIKSKKGNRVREVQPKC